MLNRHTIRVEAMQSLCGLLNFITRIVTVGRPFIKRFYQAMAPFAHKKLHMNLNQDIKDDLRIWRTFLTNFNFWRPLPHPEQQKRVLHMYTDAATETGFGIYFQRRWAVGKWSSDFKQNHHSTALLELYPIVIAITLWENEFADKSVIIHCDNEATCSIVNNQTSNCSYCLQMIRYIVLQAMAKNMDIQCQYISTKDNDIADSLSRFQWARFRREAPDAQMQPERIPKPLWPVSNQLLTELPYKHTLLHQSSPWRRSGQSS